MSDAIQTTEPVAEPTTQPVTTVQETAVPKFGDLLKHAPEGYKDLKTWDKFRDLDVPTALKVVADMDKWTGKRGDIPDEKATPEEWTKFYEKLGVPKDSNGYSFRLSDEIKAQLGEQAQGVEQYLEKAKEVALKNNIPAKSVDGFLKEMMAHEMSLRGQVGEQAKAEREANRKALEAEWGESFDDMAAAVKSLEKNYNITPEDMDSIESNPKTLILLGRIAKDLDEKGQAGNAFSNTQIGLKDELSDVEGQITTVLKSTKGDMNDPRLVSLLSRRDRLLEKLG